jgi:hypothetical protein
MLQGFQTCRLLTSIQNSMTFRKLKPLSCKGTEATSGLDPLETANPNHGTYHTNKGYTVWTLRASSVSNTYEILDDRQSAEIE